MLSSPILCRALGPKLMRWEVKAGYFPLVVVTKRKESRHAV